MIKCVVIGKSKLENFDLYLVWNETESIVFDAI